MKRLMSAISLILVLSILCILPSASALETSEEDAIEQVTEQFLRNLTETRYLYKDSDLTSNTVMALPSTRAANEQFVFENETYALSALKSNISFVQDKANYYRHLRSSNDDPGDTLLDFTVAYIFNNISTDGDKAVVEVKEEIDFQYSDLDVPTYIGNRYTVKLLKLDGAWLVADALSDDWFDQYYRVSDEGRAKGFNLQTELSTIDATLAKQREYSEQITEDKLINPEYYEALNAELMSVRPRSTYMTGVEYARKYAKNYNSTVFGNYNGPDAGDCMNFASQCVYADWGGDLDKSAVDAKGYPMDTTGDYRWYAKPTATYWSWTSCTYFFNYCTDIRVSGERDGLHTVIHYMTPKEDFSAFSTSVLPGTICHVPGAKGDYTHAVFLVQADGTARGEVLYCAHNGDALNEKMSNFGSCNVRLIFVDYI